MLAARGALVVAALALGCGAPVDPMDDPADASLDDAPDDTRDAPTDARDVATDTRDAVTDTRDVATDTRDAVTDTRDAVTDTRDAVTDTRDVATDVRDALADTLADTADAGVDASPDGSPRCPEGATLVAGRVCVDRWEASLEEVSLDGGVIPWSPYHNPGTRTVRAVSRPGVVPQGYIAGDQAARACAAAGRRLCALDEWLAACRGPAGLTYPYGNVYTRRRCNEGRSVHPVVQFFGTSMGVFTFENMNNPGINMQPDTVARTGAFAGCESPTGAFDMVGNLHEWIADPSGTFKGGFYVDAVINGPGCLYTTTAHAFTYRDYSTGFRCCADPAR